MIVVENGSTDGTLAIADELARRAPEVRVEHRADADYGRALRAGLLAAPRRRGRQLRHRLLRPRLPRRRGRAGARARRPGDRRRLEARRGRDRRPRAPLRKLATAVFSTMLRVGVRAARLRHARHEGDAPRRGRAVRAQRAASGQDLFDTELILRVERAGLRTRRDPGRGARAAARPARSILRRVPRTLRGLVKLRDRAVAGPPRVTDARARPGSSTARAASRPRRRGSSIGDGRIVATGVGRRRRAGAIDLGDALLAPGFVDLQVNGAGAVDFATATVDEIVARGRRARRRRLHRRACPTICSAPLDAYDGDARPAGRGARRAARRGARRAPRRPVPRRRARRAPARRCCGRSTSTWLVALCDAYGDLVRLVTLAPEADPGLARRPRRCASAASSSRSGTAPSTTTARAPRPTPARGSSRTSSTAWGRCTTARPGSPGAALDDRAARAVAHRRLRARAPGGGAARARRPARRGARHRPVGGDLDVRDGAARLADGTLAGSTSRCSKPCSTSSRSGSRWVRRCAPRPATRRACSGSTDRGRVAPGCRADLVGLDPATLSLRARWPAADPPGS